MYKNDKKDNKTKGRTNSSYKGGKNRKFQDEKEDSTEVRGVPKGGFNSPEWYARNPQLLIDAASLPYSEPVGTTINLDGGDYPSHSLFPESIPGVFALSVVPTAGKSTNGASALNIAARNIYSFVRHANAGHSNYDSPDLMIYLLCMDSLYSCYAWLVRAYGIMRTYSVYNRYLPKALIAAMGIDPGIINEMADFRLFINTVAVKIGSMCTPATMSYFVRHMWLFSGVYADAPTAKAQLYLYKPAGFYRYDAIGDVKGGAARYQQLPYAEMTFGSIQEYVNDLIAQVITDEDMNIMSGDILKAFGPEGVNKLSTISEDYLVIPEFNSEVLTQIHNATMVGNIGSSSLDVQQDAGGSLICRPYVTDPCPGLAGKRVLSLPTNTPAPGDNMVATRLCVICKDLSSSENMYTSEPDSFGSEMLQYGAIYTLNKVGNFDVKTVSFTNKVDNVGTNWPQELASISLLDKFDYHPSLRFMFYDGENFNLLCEMMDVDNYTILSKYELAKMHDTAILSMFNVPQMGAYSQTPNRK